ncbi:uncharacterized protein LOC111062008 [Nilaparvata lugens]|uniref:uncharacterized protein LOC111062008 n=1 Tax=Nilaparvata lugens TaxID=108931 RepID=UPI00193E34E8|nr:uncharacterized protein LOC111062008 [Nilaparvata lugens]
MPKCAIASCPYTIILPSDSVNFYRFPLGDRDSLEKWITGLKISELDPPLSNFVCDLHFESSCYEKGKLKINSIPTLINEANQKVNNTHHTDHNFKGLASVFEQRWGGFLCRVCGDLLSEDDMYLLFDGDVMEKLRCCLPFLMITNHDDLPSHICGTCMDQIDALFKFRALTTVTDQLFSHINNIMVSHLYFYNYCFIFCFINFYNTHIQSLKS